MKPNSKQNLRSACKCLMGSLAAIALLGASQAWAFPTTGTCAMLVAQPVAYGQTLPATNGLNLLAALTFTSATTGTYNFMATNAVYQSSGPVAQTSPAPFLHSGTFTMGASLIPNAKLVSMTETSPTPGPGGTFNMYAVNSDKTVLVQGLNVLATGVCQF